MIDNCVCVAQGSLYAGLSLQTWVGNFVRHAAKLRFSFNLPQTSAAYNIFNARNFRLGPSL